MSILLEKVGLYYPADFDFFFRGFVPTGEDATHFVSSLFDEHLNLRRSRTVYGSVLRM